MNALARFEAFMQELMDRRVVRLLGGSLQPVDLAHALGPALDPHAATGLAPSEFRVLLNPADAAELRELDPALEAKLTDCAVELARERGLNFTSPPRVLLLADGDLDAGSVHVETPPPALARPGAGRRSSKAHSGSRPPSSPTGTPAGPLPPPDIPPQTAEAPRGPADGAVFTPDAVGQSEPACAARNIAPQRGRHQAGGAAAISRAAGQALHLEIPEDGTRVARLPVDRFPFTIGRRAGNALVLPDPRVSREHAIIERDGGRFRLRDLGSHNGTTINGQPVAQAELCDGDRLAIGGFELLVRLRAGR